MKENKREFRFFSIPEWKKEQAYLRERHQSGWRFTRVDFIGLYHFERCEPEDVVYQLDYNPHGLAHKESYLQMFRDCGWEYLQDYAGYSYFRKPASEMKGEEEIFCDDSSRLDMMKRVFKGRMIPLLILFFCIILPNLYLQSHFASPFTRPLLWIWIGMALLYVVLFLRFGHQLYQYWRDSAR